MKTGFVTLGAACLVAGSALAQEPLTFRGPDFVVDWPKLVGQTVRVTDGRVATASERFAQLVVQGGNIALYPPWANREDLRYLFQNCTGVLTNGLCDFDVIGQVRRRNTDGAVTITNVRFVRPSRPPPLGARSSAPTMTRSGDHTVLNHNGVKVWKPPVNPRPRVETRIVTVPTYYPPPRPLGPNEGWQISDEWKVPYRPYYRRY